MESSSYINAVSCLLETDTCAWITCAELLWSGMIDREYSDLLIVSPCSETCAYILVLFSHLCRKSLAGCMAWCAIDPGCIVVWGNYHLFVKCYLFRCLVVFFVFISLFVSAFVTEITAMACLSLHCPVCMQNMTCIFSSLYTIVHITHGRLYFDC